MAVRARAAGGAGWQGERDGLGSGCARREPGPLDLDAIRKLWPELAKKVDKRLG